MRAARSRSLRAGGCPLPPPARLRPARLATAGLPGGARRGRFCTLWNFAADFLLKVMEMGGWWSVAGMMPSCLIFFFPFLLLFFCIYGAYFLSVFAGRVANGELGWSLQERFGSRSPSVRGQRRGMTPRAAERKLHAGRTPGVYFSQTCSPPFPLPAPSEFLLYKICISNTLGKNK